MWINHITGVGTMAEDVDDGFVNKLSPKAILGCDSVAAVKSLPNGPLFDLIGVIRGTISKTTQYGESVGLKGDFEATALVGENKGKTFRSMTAYLPNNITEMVVSRFNSDPEAKLNGLPFAVTIGKTDPPKGKASSTGYEYTARPKVAKGYDPLASARKLLSAGE